MKIKDGLYASMEEYILSISVGELVGHCNQLGLYLTTSFGKVYMYDTKRNQIIEELNISKALKIWRDNES